MEGVIVEEFFAIVGEPVAALEDAQAYQLSLAEYQALPKPERALLRRLAFGMPTPACFSCIYDLAHLKDILVAENERTGEFPERWVDQSEEDELAQFLAK
jgi:hypothetical protein